MNKNTVLIIIFIYLTLNTLGQSNQSIRINIASYEDTSLILTSYFGNKIRLVDTAYSNKGKFEFKSNDNYPGGIYMAVSSNKIKLFEFIINDEPKLSFSTDTLSIIRNMKIKGSKENEVFFEYVKFNESVYKQNRELSEKLRNTTKDEGEYFDLVSKLDSLNQVSIDYKLKIIREKPDLFVSKLLNSMREEEIPDSVKSLNDSLFTYNYYTNHYWDNLNLADSRFLRTPMLDKKVSEYFERLVVFQPDSVIKAIDLVLSKSKSSEEIFSYLIWRFVSEYQNPKYMGFDKVFVHLVETYFQNPDYNIENATESVINTLVERSNKIKPLLLGSKAPNLILIDTTGQYTSFNDLKNKYLAIIFWDYDCGICKKEIKYVNENLLDWKYDIGIFAINVNSDLDKWKAYVKDNNLDWTNVNGTRSVTSDFHDIYDIYGTPVIYLLNEERNIVAKRMGAEQITTIIERLEKHVSISNKRTQIIN